MGPRSVIIKGGHRRGPATDLFYDGKTFRELTGPRIRIPNTHGTGCTLSAAIAAHLAQGMAPEKAAAQAKRYVTRALRGSFSIGSGAGPLDHFYFLRRR
jgi:hydroxymethylpyrimidine/phosphomethylpyrimidine kinase